MRNTGPEVPDEYPFSPGLCFHGFLPSLTLMFRLLPPWKGVSVPRTGIQPPPTWNPKVISLTGSGTRPRPLRSPGLTLGEAGYGGPCLGHRQGSRSQWSPHEGTLQGHLLWFPLSGPTQQGEALVTPAACLRHAGSQSTGQHFMKLGTQSWILCSPPCQRPADS